MTPNRDHPTAMGFDGKIVAYWFEFGMAHARELGHDEEMRMTQELRDAIDADRKRAREKE